MPQERARGFPPGQRTVKPPRLVSPAIQRDRRSMFHAITLCFKSPQTARYYESEQRLHLMSIMSYIPLIQCAFMIIAALFSSTDFSVYFYAVASCAMFSCRLMLIFKCVSLHSWSIAFARAIAIACVAFSIEECGYIDDQTAYLLFLLSFTLISTIAFPWSVQCAFIIYACVHFSIRVFTSHLQTIAIAVLGASFLLLEYVVERRKRDIFCLAAIDNQCKQDLEEIIRTVIPAGVFVCSKTQLGSNLALSAEQRSFIAQTPHSSHQQPPQLHDFNQFVSTHTATTPIHLLNNTSNLRSHSGFQIDFANARCLEELGCINFNQVLNRINFFKGILRNDYQNREFGNNERVSTPLLKHRSNSGDAESATQKIKQESLRHVINEYLNQIVHLAEEQQFPNVLFDDGSQFTRRYDIKLVRCTWESRDACLCVLSRINDQLIGERQNRYEEFEKRIVSTITHNLKTPLNGIILLLQCVLQSQEGMSDEIFSQIEDVYTNSELLLCMINDVLDYSKIQQGSFRLTPTKFRIDTLLLEVNSLYKTQLNKKQLELFLEYSSMQELSLFTDYERLKQVILNLAGNALKFTFSGHIKILVKEAQEDGNILEIEISDTGNGISKDIKQNLLHSQNPHIDSEAQRRLDKQSGSGIGLSMCQCLVEKLGPHSKLFIQSVESEGTKISFFIYRSLIRKRIASFSGQNSVRNKKKSLSMKPHYPQYHHSPTMNVSSPLGNSTMNIKRGFATDQSQQSVESASINQNQLHSSNLQSNNGTQSNLPQNNQNNSPVDSEQQVISQNKVKQIKRLVKSNTLSIFQGLNRRSDSTGSSPVCGGTNEDGSMTFPEIDEQPITSNPQIPMQKSTPRVFTTNDNSYCIQNLRTPPKGGDFRHQFLSPRSPNHELITTESEPSSHAENKHILKNHLHHFSQSAAAAAQHFHFDEHHLQIIGSANNKQLHHMFVSSGLQSPQSDLVLIDEEECEDPAQLSKENQIETQEICFTDDKFIVGISKPSQTQYVSQANPSSILKMHNSSQKTTNNNSTVSNNNANTNNRKTSTLSRKSSKNQSDKLLQLQFHHMLPVQQSTQTINLHDYESSEDLSEQGVHEDASKYVMSANNAKNNDTFLIVNPAEGGTPAVEGEHLQEQNCNQDPLSDKLLIAGFGLLKRYESEQTIKPRSDSTPNPQNLCWDPHTTKHEETHHWSTADLQFGAKSVPFQHVHFASGNNMSAILASDFDINSETARQPEQQRSRVLSFQKKANSNNRRSDAPLFQIRNILENKSVLIVDDTMFNVIALKSVLLNATMQSIQIDEAYNGAQAVEKVTQRGNDNLYDFIFMDINMPVMDGLQATEAIKQMNRANRIIIVTAFSDETDRAECNRIGADGFLTKPVKIKELAQQIQRVNALYSLTNSTHQFLRPIGTGTTMNLKSEDNNSDPAIPSPSTIVVGAITTNQSVSRIRKHS